MNLSDPFYISKGKAGEYSEDLSLNIFKYCPFACSYCYVPNVLKTTAFKYFNGSELAVNIYERVFKHISKYEGRNVFLSFIGDFFNGQSPRLTVDLLKLFIEHDISLKILTKGNAFPYFNLLKKVKDINFGVTLTTLDLKNINKYEPYALNPYLRVKQLKEAKELGFRTWVSIEPVIDPFDIKKIIELTKDFTDFYYIGEWNYGSKPYDDPLLYCSLNKVKELLKEDRFKIKEQTLLKLNQFNGCKI